MCINVNLEDSGKFAFSIALSDVTNELESHGKDYTSTETKMIN